MGANLGFGGLVKKNCIECPFHQWKFDGRDGSVVDIPYSKNIDDWKDKGTITNFDSLKRHFKLFDSISCKKWED
jgi:nitrite reductase/ring-hydroxylating ferredoxin subunit